MSFSDYAENALLDHLLKGTALTQPANIYIALFSTDPGETGVSGEIAGNGYARKLHNTWVAAASGVKKNSGVCTFAPCSTAPWGTIAYFGIFDAITGGNFLGGGSLSASKSIGVNDIAEFADQSISISLD